MRDGRGWTTQGLSITLRPPHQRSASLQIAVMYVALDPASVPRLLVLILVLVQVAVLKAFSIFIEFGKRNHRITQ